MSPRGEDAIDTLLGGPAPPRLVEQAESAEPIDAAHRATQRGRGARGLRWRADPESRGLQRVAGDLRTLLASLFLEREVSP